MLSVLKQDISNDPSEEWDKDSLYFAVNLVFGGVTAIGGLTFLTSALGFVGVASENPRVTILYAVSMIVLVIVLATLANYFVQFVAFTDTYETHAIFYLTAILSSIGVTSSAWSLIYWDKIRNPVIVV